MRKLLQFLYKNNHWFLFILLEVASVILIVRSNSYQHSVYLTSANSIFGAASEFSSSITSYFHLKSINEELLDKNIELERKLSLLEDLFREHKLMEEEDLLLKESVLNKYVLYPAHVIKNSIIMPNNFITIDKGAKDGIKPDMGVINGNGVVGIVYKTSTNYSWVMSLLNSKFDLSCKILGSNYSGNIVWDYGDSRYAELKDLPRHATYSLGDTIVTSGYSAIFPEGVMVGTIDDVPDKDDGLSYILRIRLAVDFGKLDGVRIIENRDLIERRALEAQ